MGARRHDRASVECLGGAESLPCMPCDKLGCEGLLNSDSQCLDELLVQRVLAAVDQALALRSAAA